MDNNHSLWLRFDLPAADWGDKQWVLRFPVAILRHVRLFTVNPATGAVTRSPPQGLDYPQRPHFQHSRQIAFPLKPPPNQPLQVFLEVKSPQLYQLPLSLTGIDEFEQHVSRDLLMMGTLHGILLVMLFYNLGLAVALREPGYVYYSAYVAGSLWYLATITGVGPYYVWNDTQWLIDHGSLTAASFTFFMATFYIRHFLELYRYGPWIRHSNALLLAFWLVLTVLFSQSEETQLNQLVSPFTIITSLVGLSTAIYLSFKGVVLARFFTTAWVVLILGTIVFALVLEHILPFNVFTAYAQMVGMVVELIVLSFALAYRIQKIQQDREQAQANALNHAVKASQERSRRLDMQQEILDLQKNLNERLEKQVQVRTRQYEELVCELEDTNTRLSHLSRTDTLTQVGNRRSFDEALLQECRRARRNEQSLAVVLVDIDHFKSVNDSHGHPAGDECIRAVAEALVTVISRPGDLLARFGGEEFVYLLPDTNTEQALAMAERCRLLIAGLELRHENHRIPLTVSLGVAAWVPQEGDDLRLVDAADKALYQAKQSGRNRTVISSCESAA